MRLAEGQGERAEVILDRRGIAAVSISGENADHYFDINQQYQQHAAHVPATTMLVLSFQAVTRSTVIKSISLGGNSLGITPQPQICKPKSLIPIILPGEISVAQDTLQLIG